MTAHASSRVFLSFASADSKLANALIDLLRLGCNLPEEKVFSTARPGTLAPGIPFANAIREALDSAALSVHLLTPAYYESDFCLSELGAVWIKQIGHVPLLVPPIDFASLDGVQLGEQALQIDVRRDLDQLRQSIDAALAPRANITEWNDQKEKFLDEWGPSFESARARFTPFARAAANVPAARRPLLVSRQDLGTFLPEPRDRLVRRDDPLETATTAFISGIDGNEIVKSNSGALEQVLARPDGKVRILLLDPVADPTGTVLPNVDHFADSTAFRTALRASLSKLADIQKRARGDLQYRLLPFLPAVHFFVTDPDDEANGTFKVEAYTPLGSDPGLGRPHLILGPELAEWRRQFLRVWERYWSLAREPDDTFTDAIVPQTVYAALQDHHQEVFSLDSHGRLWHRWFPDAADEWSDWWRMEDAPLATGVATASTGSSALHLFLASVDGRVERRSWMPGRGWGAWTTLSSGGRTVFGHLAALSRTPQHLEVYAKDGDETVHGWAFWSEATQRWDWSDWHRFEPPPA